ncbi:rhodanese [Amylibacter marinus]|uniref:Rhodanese n=1 Tax=Amylibacter marinus TaxID=1475483 RepID=A0ABQ5VSY8_9RHOB|nr:rhodanese-like domain-containing protein [Amylibacter marinus]GLQ34338.1 rhodanese [Amylibacter marinus]
MITPVADMVAAANAEITTISTTQAQTYLAQPDYLFIDIRDPRELARSGKIPNAFSCPRGMLEFWIDPASPYHKEIFARDATFVFYCASAWRSALATKAAQDMGLKNVCHIKGGFSAWAKAGMPIASPS